MTDHSCSFPKLWYWDDLAIVTVKEKPPTILTCYFLQFLFRQNIISCTGPVFSKQHKWFCHPMGLCSCLFLTGELQMRKMVSTGSPVGGGDKSVMNFCQEESGLVGGGAQRGTDTAGGGVSFWKLCCISNEPSFHHLLVLVFGPFVFICRELDQPAVC